MTFETALTGLNAASTKLGAISNNIANNATTGFKRSRAEFSDVFAKSTLGYSAVAVGQGVRNSAIKQEFTQGNVSFTNNNFDIAISGEGMFRMTDGNDAYYTRAGTFGLDPDGFIVNNQGSRLSGYSTDSDNMIVPIADDLQLDFSELPPKATEEVEITLNLSSEAEVLAPFDVTDPSSVNFSTSASVYDSLGTPQVSTVYFHKDTPNSWSAYTYVDDVEVSQPGGDEIIFTDAGEIATINGAPGNEISTSVFNPVSGGAPMSVDINFGGTTQFDNPFGVNRISQDGYAAGRLNNFDIDEAGVIFGRFTNSQAKIMGQVTLTKFANTQGLQQIGNSSWSESYSSGEPVIGVPKGGSFGNLQSGALESSNVDITQELVSMIGAQRSFQANAQVISTADTLTQTVINLKR
ncbi:MAG: flagellar hook protein FlgE [Granulosicoccaceae bacterium]